MQGRKLVKPSRLTPPPAVFCKYSAFLCWVQTKTNKKTKPLKILSGFAVRTGLEPVTPCVTGMYSNQLN